MVNICILIVKIMLYFLLGFISILFKIFNREWQSLVISLVLIYSWFYACGKVYTLGDMSYPILHFIFLYIYFSVKGYQLLHAKNINNNINAYKNNTFRNLKRNTARRRKNNEI
jgi:hypothetical protein